MEFEIGLSPCPNDTFMFCAMLEGLVDTHGITFIPVMKDVQELNKLALNDGIDITKLSFYTYCQVKDNYNLLDSGSALGRGVGPLLVTLAKSEFNMEVPLPSNVTVAIPGKDTTANFLFSYFQHDEVAKKFMIFNEIEGAIINELVDCGVIIHENRFTYEAKGLKKIIDLGDYWENKTGNAIPLGGIVIKKEIDISTQHTIDALIKESIEYAFSNYPLLNDYIRSHAQEMSEPVMRQHIDLYVNEYSLDLGDMGKNAILKLLNLHPIQSGVNSKNMEHIFLTP